MIRRSIVAEAAAWSIVALLLLTGAALQFGSTAQRALVAALWITRALVEIVMLYWHRKTREVA